MPKGKVIQMPGIGQNPKHFKRAAVIYAKLSATCLNVASCLEAKKSITKVLERFNALNTQGIKLALEASRLAPTELLAKASQILTDLDDKEGA